MPEIATVSEMVMVPIREIKPYQRNPRKNNATVDKLVELLKAGVGFNQPLLLDRQNVIVKGHTRWAAGLKLKMKALPCVYTDADPETIRLDRLADNRIQEYSTWDDDLLKSELGALHLPFEFNLGTLDFDMGQPEPATMAITAAEVVSNGAAAAPAGEPEPGAGDQGGGADPETASAPIAEPQYIEAVCNSCGNHLFVRIDKG